MTLDILISQIHSLDGVLKQEANKAVNRLLTLRNWLIGYYIVEYEQKGEDRAKYGDNLLQNLASDLNQEGLSYRNLKLFKQFFLMFPSIGQTVSAQLKNSFYLPDKLLNSAMQIGQTPSAQLQNVDNQSYSLHSDESYNINEKIISKLSFSHITLLLPLDDQSKRNFYAIEAIKGTWSVRELKRQINSLLFERSGISAKPDQLLQNLEKINTQASFIKDIYTFEFLGLPIKDAVEESDLETALLDHLQQFLLEMGHGFCLESRQKRILIGEEYFFIDLVFYHRILKCHVLIDLKVEEFNHSNAGQLNTYINYYKKEIQLPGDNPPIGILMVTNKTEALVEYATAGMDEKLFVRKYLLELPDKKKIEAFIKNELRTL